MAKAKIKKPAPGTRAESLLSEDPKAIVGRIRKQAKAFQAKTQGDLQTLMGADGGMDAVFERLLADLERFEEGLKGTEEYLNEKL